MTDRDAYKEGAMPNLCIYCGSSSGFHPDYQHAAVELARLMVAQGWNLVYGGGSIGVMGIMADTVIAAGGKVIGIIPEFLATREVMKDNCTELFVTDSMHSRKRQMMELSDAFVALPGGYGTLEELLETITWKQLGLHNKPIAVLNTRQFFTPLIGQIDHLVTEGFVRPEHRLLLRIATTPVDLLEQLSLPAEPPLKKWFNTQEI